MFRKAASRLAGGTVGYVGCAALHNTISPLHVVWDLDETLISSERIDNKWRADQAMQILRLSSSECEHVDDDALHFIFNDKAERGASTESVKRFTGLPPERVDGRVRGLRGERRSVARGDRFKPLRQDRSGPALFRQGTQSSHDATCSPRRQPPVLPLHTTREWHLGARLMTHPPGSSGMGGRLRACSRAYAVRASKQARQARWPLEPRLFSGEVVGGGTAFDSNGDASSKPRMKTRKTVAALRRRRTEEENEVADRMAVRHKLLVAAFPEDDRSGKRRRRDTRIRELAERAKSDGGAALLVVDPKNIKAARVPIDIDFPVVTAGKCGRSRRGEPARAEPRPAHDGHFGPTRGRRRDAIGSWLLYRPCCAGWFRTCAGCCRASRSAAARRPRGACLGSGGAKLFNTRS